MIKKLSHEEAVDVLDEFDVKDIETAPSRWGHETRYVYKDEQGKHWSFWMRFHSEEGIVDEGEVDFVEVKPVEKIVISWEPV